MKDESIFLVLFFCTAIVSFLMSAEMPAAAPLVAENHDDRCHDPRLDADWQQMLDAAPDDPVALKSYALRAGLCQMLESGEISPLQAAEIWAPEAAHRTVSGSSY